MICLYSLGLAILSYMTTVGYLLSFLHTPSLLTYRQTDSQTDRQTEGCVCTENIRKFRLQKVSSKTIGRPRPIQLLVINSELTCEERSDSKTCCNRSRQCVIADQNTEHNSNTLYSDYNNIRYSNYNTLYSKYNNTTSHV